MWIVVAIVVIGCCIAAAASGAEEEKQKKEAGAKRPEALARLFNEEFSGIGATLTYTQADVTVKNWEKLEKSFAWSSTRSFTGKKFSSEKAKIKAAKLLNERVISGPGIDEMARNNPAAFADKMVAVLESSKTLSGST